MMHAISAIAIQTGAIKPVPFGEQNTDAKLHIYARV